MCSTMSCPYLQAARASRITRRCRWCQQPRRRRRSVRAGRDHAGPKTAVRILMRGCLDHARVQGPGLVQHPGPGPGHAPAQAPAALTTKRARPVLGCHPDWYLPALLYALEAHRVTIPSNQGILHGLHICKLCPEWAAVPSRRGQLNRKLQTRQTRRASPSTMCSSASIGSDAAAPR